MRLLAVVQICASARICNKAHYAVPVVVFVVLVVVVTVARSCSVVTSSCDCSCPSLMAGRIGGSEKGSKQTDEEGIERGMNGCFWSDVYVLHAVFGYLSYCLARRHWSGTLVTWRTTKKAQAATDEAAARLMSYMPPAHGI